MVELQSGLTTNQVQSVESEERYSTTDYSTMWSAAEYENGSKDGMLVAMVIKGRSLTSQNDAGGDTMSTKKVTVSETYFS